MAAPVAAEGVSARPSSRRDLVYVALAALAPGVLLLPLLRPGRILMVRDLAFFHLPLRQAMVALVRAGTLPEWNPLVHGGQPILSNPNYAAFYPPTWLALLVGVPYALQLLVVLHAAWALWGTWRLLRGMGCGPAAAALGALGFAGSSWFLALTSTFNFFCAMAWFPWVLALGLAAVTTGRRWSGAALGAAAALAAQLLAGEPVAVLVSALALVCVGGAAAPRRSTLGRLLAIALLASALGAVQLVPTLHRLQGGARAAGLAPLVADRWSTPPARLVDLVLPHFWGDSTRDEEGLWFGWGLHDQDFPYVIALYSGLLTVLLALVGLLAVRVRHRAGWAAAALLGVLLALGRHDPLWEALRRALPLFAVLRYPEKFVVLTTAVVPLVAALAWQEMLATREAPPPDTTARRRALAPAGIGAGLGAALAVAVGGLALLAFTRPATLRAFVLAHSGLPPAPDRLAAAVSYLRREALLSLAFAAATAALLALLAARRLPARTAGALALLLLGADLVVYGRGLTPTLPGAVMLAPPAAAAEVRARGGRLASALWLDERPEIGLRQGPPGFQQLWARAQRLDPYIGSVFGLESALDRDYDLMLTGWGRHALGLLQDAWPQRPPVDRLLGAWDVGSLVVRRDARDVLRELRATGRPPRTFAIMPVTSRLPRYRFVSDIGRLDEAESAGAAVADLDLARQDLCLGPDAPPAAAYASGRVLAAEGEQRPRVRYAASGEAFLVAAITFDDGWRGTLEDGREVALCPTALGQIGARVPSGEHTLSLRYRDPWVRVGAAVTGITLLLAALVALRRGERVPLASP